MKFDVAHSCRRIWSLVGRRSVWGTLLLVLCIPLLQGCGRSGDTGVEIRFWAMGSEGENVRQLIQEFERRNPGIRVRLQVIPWTAAHEKLLTAYAGNSTPDVAQLGNTWVPEFRVLDALELLDPWIRSSGVIRAGSYFPGI